MRYYNETETIDTLSKRRTSFKFLQRTKYKYLIDEDDREVYMNDICIDNRSMNTFAYFSLSATGSNIVRRSIVKRFINNTPYYCAEEILHRSSIQLERYGKKNKISSMREYLKNIDPLCKKKGLYVYYKTSE